MCVIYVGYALYYHTPKSMKPEYQGLRPEEYKQLRANKIEFMDNGRDVLQLVYTGDTTIEGLLLPENQFIFQSPIFITELTYMTEGNLNMNDRKDNPGSDTSRQKAAEFGHIHLDDIVENKDLFHAVEQLVFVHLSMRYQPYYKALEWLRAQLPDELIDKSYVCLKALGNEHFMTKILNNNHHNQKRHYMGSSRDNNSHVGHGWGSHKRTIQRPQSASAAVEHY